MSASVPQDQKKITVPYIRQCKQEGKKLSMLTAYDFTFASLVDLAGIDMVLVGDSAANVMAGYQTTLPITLDEMIYHAASVKRGVRRALVVADLPFGAYQGSKDDALRSAIRMMKEAQVEALKLEGGKEIMDTVTSLTHSGIPVMGHLGLTPQSVNQFGGYGLRAKGDAEAKRLRTDALLLQDAGAFALVLEKIPAALAASITEELEIPVIGIGAGNACDGQVLVLQDMLGMTQMKLPKFVRQYAQLGNVIQQAVAQYAADVRSGDFPSSGESY